MLLLISLVRQVLKALTDNLNATKALQAQLEQFQNNVNDRFAEQDAKLDQLIAGPADETPVALKITLSS